jgi:hypothetical protein
LSLAPVVLPGMDPAELELRHAELQARFAA